MKNLVSVFTLLSIISTTFTTNAFALNRQEILKCETDDVRAEMEANIQAIDNVANALLARSGDDRLVKKMVEIGQNSTSCRQYTASVNSFLKQVREDLIRLDKTLTLDKKASEGGWSPE